MDEFTTLTLDAHTYRATPDAVAFIKEYRLAKGVTEIVSNMRALLPSLVDVQLEVLQDPTCDCDPELCIRALFPADVDPAAADTQLDEFDEAWWLDNSDRWHYRIEVHPGWLP